jgi:formiminoglutamase
MNIIKIYHQDDIKSLVRIRDGEVKIGEQVSYLQPDDLWETQLQNSECTFVLLGIPEDIGVKANYGRGGADTAWKPALESFLNQQSNVFLTGENVTILGHVYVEDLIKKTKHCNPKNSDDLYLLRETVKEIDNRVKEVIKKIIDCGKIPVIVGGGHNNSYPIIKGCSLSLNQKINVINCDPHTDFRALEGRHSGNGFSYAYNENYMSKYSVLCMHEQYNTLQVLKEFNSNSNLYYSTYEDVFIREKYSFTQTLERNISFVKSNYCGVEIDLDSITNVPSSAKTSSGISPIQARQYVYQCGKNLNVKYFHIAEGAPILSHIKADNKTGKLIAYLISDFIKGVMEQINN